MGIPDSSLFYLLHKVRSWISWGASDLSPSCLSANFEMPNNDTVNMCSECDSNNNQFLNGYHCQSCGKWSCFNCMRGYQFNVVNCNADFGEAIKYCKFCNGVTVKRDGGRKNDEKVHPTDSPRGSPEPPSPSFSAASIQSDHLAHYLESRGCGFSPNTITSRSMTSFSAHPSPVSVRRSSSRSDEEEAGDSGKLFYSPLSEYSHDISDIDSSSVSARLEFCNCKSMGSSPLDSPSRIDFSSNRAGHTVQRGREGSSLSQSDGPFDKENMVILRRPDKRTEDPENADGYSDDVSVLRDQYDKSQKPLDLESNGLIWFPPPPEDENDETESSFFTYDDEDDDIGDSSAIFLPSSSLSSTFPSKENQNEINKDPLKAVIQGHFRALVAQLLQGEGIKASKEETNEEWLDIVTTIAWQAANFVKPDTSRGGSMDPVDYVKVKCIASGNPSDSTLVKGVVCTKNIKHKRMTTQYKNPRLLLLGGALEHQSVVNQLASFNTLVQKENDHLKPIMSKIEALRPNVLLVEKSVSPFAQEYLLGKEISLVLNVKRPLLERIARCTGAYMSPSFENISTTRLGHCELFRVERVFEEHETSNQFNKKPSKTLMFFEGCPRRLGCTVLLRGTCREELKKVKHVIQYAVFAAYHLSLETSFLADEGASLPKQTVRPSIAIPERTAADESISVVSPITCHAEVALSAQDNDGSLGVKPEHEGSESLTGDLDAGVIPPLPPRSVTCKSGNELSIAYHGDLVSDVGRLDSFSVSECEGLKISVVPPPGIENLSLPELQDMMAQEGGQLMETRESVQPEKIDEDEVSSEYFSATDTYQSILVSFSSRCVLKGTVCERSRLLRIKFYGSFDKPLGRYLCDDLFNQKSCCKSCKELAEAHVLCFTHQQGNLTINVRSLSFVKLPGERDGKIWMWHRCLRCAHIDGVPPATRRVVMSAAAWGLSFGKFLELSFSNHATANRVAPCGHSLQRDCLRFYGFGSMVAFFRYSPIDILNVHLPPSVLEFNSTIQHEWIRKEASELLGKMETFYGEISGVLDSMEQRSKYFGGELSDTNELQSHIMELKDQLLKEKDDYNVMLQLAIMESSDQTVVDILELNRIRRALLIGSHVWEQKLFSLDSVLKTNSLVKAKEGGVSCTELKDLRNDIFCKDSKFDRDHEENISGYSKSKEIVWNDFQSEKKETSPSFKIFLPEHSLLPLHHNTDDEVHADGETVNKTFFNDIPSHASNLSDRIDSAWTGTNQLPIKAQPLHAPQAEADGFQPGPVRQPHLFDNPPFRRMMAPVRVHSFDSALRVQERIQKGLPPSLHLSTIRSFHASGDYRSMLRDPVSAMRTYSQTLPLEAQKLNLIPNSTHTFISSAANMAGGARLLLPMRTNSDIVIGVYDNDPASVVSYALSSKEYEDWATDRSNENGGIWSTFERSKEASAASSFTAWQSFGSVDLDYISYGGYGSEDPSSSLGNLFMVSKKSPHLTISYEDDSSFAGGKVKFSVTCYFAKQFDSLRKKCCPSDVDFVRSLSRSQKWSAQGGKSNVYFAKSLDERFIIKQIKKTELESFEEFALEYFKYLTDPLNSGSPTCLAKILGIYQVTVKHLRGGKETKMDLMVMENLFFNRNIARVYDLKGSSRSRYNPDTSGSNKVLLDTNLMETLRTDPIFLGSKAKRSLERAIWNDTSFLASVDVMDYSLLVGVDDERKELVLGIIDFMRQYTWDKHLETWVKATGILGGPKNASPTIVSPKQYKKRFRKAMTSYFLTVPDQWSS
ncbi:1-phosphatidylinositol-3-phosphate 5-kinase FAB1C isoform X1 [Populus alba x Populus x berolinensis]|uniref:1-phosphatidylinositol-3-phosphate 5-kinase n=1 Tax=Populus alba x Populus x berolinensis TaxID=444605 RepID=A0AAD6Q7G5_9ROSI|nr:1-phosphatidylinositol-3-phosphate 5-kinase FAB1C isoform X1 [Populus alba x Populus x berolinensis]